MLPKTPISAPSLTRSLIFLTLSGFLSFLTSCGHIHTKSHTYTKAQGNKINGATVTSAVKPMGGGSGFAFSAMVYMAGSATLDGPFIWRVEAEGIEGQHESLTVHRIKVTTSKTKRSEWFPRQHLGHPVPFKPYKKEPGKVFANFQLPGKLKVFPRTDGDITVLAEVSVSTKTKTQRRVIRFRLAAGTNKTLEFISLPGELAKGYQKDPRDWKW